ncbi:hypothetical protein D3C72_2121490 [compost metagenome]
MENATASGYRQNCSNEITKPMPNSNSSGTLGSIASGAEASANPTATLRISTARS